MMTPSVLLIIRILKFGPGLLARDTLKSIFHRSNIISIVLETQPKQVNKPNIQIKYSSSCLLSKTKFFVRLVQNIPHSYGRTASFY